MNELIFKIELFLESYKDHGQDSTIYVILSNIDRYHLNNLDVDFSKKGKLRWRFLVKRNDRWDILY